MISQQLGYFTSTDSKDDCKYSNMSLLFALGGSYNTAIMSLEKPRYATWVNNSPKDLCQSHFHLAFRGKVAQWQSSNILFPAQYDRQGYAWSSRRCLIY